MRYDLYEIVMSLTGPVQATGDHGTDQRRLTNMGELTNLVGLLLFEIARAVPCADPVEASMKAIGEHARDFLVEVKTAIAF